MEEVIINVQPVYNYEINSCLFSEVLIRQYKGINGPDNILEYARKNSICKQLDLDILTKAFSITEAIGMALSVNITPESLEDVNLINDIIYILENNRESIIFEINEKTNFNNITVKDNLHKLKELGFKLALDDFGTFNSNIEVLNKYTFDIVKVDKSYLNKLDELEKLKSLFTDLLLIVVVEGVEDNQTLQELFNLGYKIIQGYVFTKPMDIETLQSMLN